MLTDVYKRFLAGDEVEIYPQRGTNAVPIAFNPNDRPRLHQHVEPAAHPEDRAAEAAGAGRPISTGVVGRNPVVKPGDVVGYFAAINPVTGEKKWEVPLIDMPSSAGMLVDRRRARCSPAS